MAIKPISEMKKRGLEIDLTGPDGNAYVLMGLPDSLDDDSDKSDKDKKTKPGDKHKKHLPRDLGDGQ